MIDKFRGEAGFLSNFYTVPGGLTDEMGITYPTVEHMFQAAKCKDYNIRLRVSQEPTPAEAKHAGSRKGYVPLRRDWAAVKVSIMNACLTLKFREPSMREKLKRTGDSPLIEGNTWGDTFWGVCNGQGENVLGRLLMEIREKIQ